MAGENQSALHRKSKVPSRRGFLGAAGIAAAGALIDQVNAAQNAQATRNATTTNSDPDHPQRPTCLALTADKTEVVTCDDAGAAHLWDLTDLTKPPLTYLFPNNTAKRSFVAVSQLANPVVLTASFDATIWVHSLHTATAVAGGPYIKHQIPTAKKNEVWAVAVTDDGKVAVSGTNAGNIQVWDVASYTQLATVDPTHEPVASLAIISGAQSTDVHFLAGYGGGVMEKWTYAASTKKLTSGKKFLHRTAATVNSIALFTKNGSKFAITGAFDSSVRMWDLNKAAKPQQTFKKHDHFIWRVAAYDDNTFASVSEDGNLVVFDYNGNEAARELAGAGTMGLAFLDDSKVVVTTNLLKVPEVTVVPI